MAREMLEWREGCKQGEESEERSNSSGADKVQERIRKKAERKKSGKKEATEVEYIDEMFAHNYPSY